MTDEGNPSTPQEQNQPGEGAAERGQLIWLDLEMTGLVVERHRIVEIAVLVTDDQLEPLDGGIDIVVHQDTDALDAMDDFVRKMHTKSGLLPEIATSTVSLEAAGAAVLQHIASHVADPAIAPVCGNSIGVDRRFLHRYLPELDDALHYRSIDVSSLKELCRRWYPDVFRARPAKQERHRALEDVKDSIAELRHYREHMLRPPG